MYVVLSTQCVPLNLSLILLRFQRGVAVAFKKWSFHSPKTNLIHSFVCISMALTKLPTPHLSSLSSFPCFLSLDLFHIIFFPDVYPMGSLLKSLPLWSTGTPPRSAPLRSGVVRLRPRGRRWDAAAAAAAAEVAVPTEEAPAEAVGDGAGGETTTTEGSSLKPPTPTPTPLTPLPMPPTPPPPRSPGCLPGTVNLAGGCLSGIVSSSSR